MDRRPTSERGVPEIRPTKAWLQAIEGAWELDGKTIWIGLVPSTGILAAVEEGGRSFNPIQVISRGRRLPDS